MRKQIATFVAVFFLIINCVLPIYSFAQWSSNPAVNNAICTAANHQQYPEMVSDNSGGAIIAWIDYRSGSTSDIYVQRIDVSGNVQWTANGVAICTATDNQASLQLVTDGNGGAIITWQDKRSGIDNDIYAQRINSTGIVQWTANGVAICSSTGYQYYPQITPDGSGGAIIAWQDYRNGLSNADIYAQRINGAGLVQWTIDGVTICAVANNQQGTQLITGSGGSAIITWQDYRSGTSNADIYAQCIDGTGLVQWIANGVAVCTAADNQELPQLDSDGIWGAIITWQDYRSGTTDIYAQRINSSGLVQWTANGVVVCSEINGQTSPQLVSDGGGGAIITWVDYRSGLSDNYAQRINATGIVQWTTNGVAICTAADYQYYPQLASDGAGGAIITWQDNRNGSNPDIYAQRVNATGMLQWTINGVVICSANNSQWYPKIISPGCIIIAWYDFRNNNNYNIYAQQIDINGTLGGGFCSIIPPLPVADFSVSDSTICEGTCVTFTDLSTNLPTSWNWTFPGGMPATSIQQNPVVCYNVAGTYNVTLIATNGNGSDTITKTLFVTVNSLPTVNAGVDQSVCTGTAVTLSGSGATSYTWDNGVTNGTPFTPLATTTYTVTGTDGNGCQNSDSVVVTVNAMPTVNAGIDQIICSGTAVTLSGSGATSYTWDNGVTNGTPFTPLATTTYTVTGTDVNGCQNSDSVVVTVNALPTVNAGIDQSVCTGTAVTLSGSGATSYIWNNGVTNGMPFTPLATTTYTVTGTDGNGCQNTDQVIITVNSLPTPSIIGSTTFCTGGSTTLDAGSYTSYLWSNSDVTQTINVTTADTYAVTVTNASGCTGTASVNVTENSSLSPILSGNNFCAGGSSVLDAGSGFLTYSWSQGGLTQTITVNTANTYFVTVTDAIGCSGTGQITISENPLPTVDAGVAQTICSGTAVTLSGSGATSYIWNNGVTNGTPFTPLATTTYTVTGTDVNGCQNTDQVIVIVNALPTVNAGIDQSVCTGTAVTLSGSGATSYTWDNGVTNGTPFTPLSTTTYTVTGTDVNGCQNTDQVIVIVNALPTVNAGIDQSVCTGTAVTLSGSGATSYTWNNGVTNGTPFTPLATTTYTVTGTDGNGCQNTDQVIVTVNPLPTVNAGIDQSVCTGTAVTLSGSGATSYTWNNGVTNGTPFTPLATTTYTVTGTDGNGCQNTDQVIVTVNALPTVNAGIDQSVCTGTSVTLSGSGATSYIWNNGVTNGTPFTPLTTTTYTVTGTDGNGCQNTDQVIVTVNPLPTVNA